MEEDHPIPFLKPDSNQDPLTEFLKMRIQKLLYAAIQVELQKFSISS